MISFDKYINGSEQTTVTPELDFYLSQTSFELFDFDYEFYSGDIKIKKEFENLFKDYYRFSVVGIAPIARFKHVLKSELNILNRTYQQLYFTELEALKIKFLLNKDLTETFERIVDKDEKGDTKSNTKSNSKSVVNDTSSTDSSSKDSNLDNGIANVKDTSLTNSSTDNSQTNSNSNSTTDNSLDNSNILTNNIKETEKTILTSQGNIGVTSGGQLLTDWRKTLLNLNQDLILNLEFLFSKYLGGYN
ncbi:MAG: hypothetical protein ACRCTZ_15105 [Sarcina sp.]